MRPMMRLVIDSRLSEIRRASELVDEFKARHGLADDDANAIHIVLDEVLSNSIRHGLAGAASHAIAVMLELSDGEITIEVEDDGVAYDPTQAPAPVLAGTLEERTEGGLGMTFVRGLTNAIEYQRIDGRNRLVLRRRIVRPA
ncbi:MAG TPA: ATP-binding protein [Usitatibacter sp.]|jgi:sigma-B regulation protein RsbU (phosphoserine phosphatase)|nr:ATP-binding protein [Usitatibacter sp.]